MIVSQKNECLQVKIFTNGNKLKQRDQFKYLGTLVSINGCNNSEIASRIVQVKKFPENEININEIISIHTRRALECYIEPVLMYGCKAWKISKQFQKKQEAKEMWFLQRVLRISWTRKKSKETMLGEADTRSLM